MNRRSFITQAAAAMAVSSFLPKETKAQTPTFQKADGANYAPRGKPNLVVKPGQFQIAVAKIDHAHIYGMCNGLTEAGATVKWVYDTDEGRVKAFLQKYPYAKVAKSLNEILDDKEVKLVCSSAIPNERAALGCQVMEAGKDYFSDKAPFTTLEQLDQIKATIARTGRKYMVYYSERLHVEAAMYATDLLERGAIGKVVQVLNIAPHRISLSTRPSWFFNRIQYGGILGDIGSHQFEQFLTYSKSSEAIVTNSAVGNFAHPDHPGLEDFGEASLIGSSGSSNYVQVNWFTADGLRTWGDGRCFILGTEGSIELRKYVDVGRDVGHEASGNNVYIIDKKGEHYVNVTGQIGFRFFGEFILDCINRTEVAMTQAHALKVGEIAVKAQEAARRLTGHLG
jgi:predicted dehydrogenase